MDAYQEFIDDRAHIDELEGQRFVVLRAPATVAEPYRRIQEQFRSRLAGLPVSYPARPHVTLCGFAAGTPLPAVQRLVEAWALDVPRLSLEIAGLITFPPPFQIVVVEVRRTPAMFSALQRIRAMAGDSGLVVSTKMPVEQWRFHMSVAYCSRLDETAWRDVVRFSETIDAGAETADVGEAEVVAFDGSREYSGGTFPLVP